MKRTPLGRKTPLRAKAVLVSNGFPKARSAIKSRSVRNVAEGNVRREIREAGTQRCQVGDILRSAGVTPPCRGRVEGLHERRKASSAGSKINEANLLRSCNPCNEFIECNPALVRQMTGQQLVVREGDPEWDSLGRKADIYLES